MVRNHKLAALVNFAAYFTAFFTAISSIVFDASEAEDGDRSDKLFSTLFLCSTCSTLPAMLPIIIELPVALNISHVLISHQSTNSRRV